MKNQIKTYAIIAFALISGFLVSCSKDVKDDNSKLLPVLSSATIANVETHRPIISAEVTSIGGSQLTERGVCFDTLPNPTVEKMKARSDSATTGQFSIKLGGLKPNTTYYARAYATNSTGTAYSSEVNFFIDAVKIGDLFGGGIVFYLEPSGHHGLVSAIAGNNHSSDWGCMGLSVAGTNNSFLF